MRILGIPEAKHYCAGFAAVASPPIVSVSDFVKNHMAGATAVKEGSPGFAALRACALRNVEGCMFQAASLYRRSFDLMTASAASWAHVTLYYGSFHSAHALLGLFGGFLDAGRVRVEVSASAPGTQELAVLRSTRPGDWGTFRGSHQRFWDYFYRAMLPLQPLVDPKLAFALTPVLAKPEWLIVERNSINYHTFTAMALATSFQATTRASKLRTTLPSTTNTQFLICEGLLRLTFDFAKGFGLVTDGLDALKPTGTRTAKVKALIYDVSRPSLKKAIRKRGIAS